MMTAKRMATYRRVDSPHPDRIWYEVTEPETGRVVGRVCRWRDHTAWEGWVRHDSGETFGGRFGTMHYAQHQLVSTGRTREAAVAGMWEHLP